MMHVGDSKSRHVFGEIESFVDSEFLAAAQDARSQLLSEYECRLRAGEPKSELNSEIGDRLHSVLHTLLMSPGAFRTTAHCYCHNRECPIFDVDVELVRSQGGIVGNASSSLCEEFSPMSATQLRAVGMSSVPFSIWVAMRAKFGEDWFLHENVFNHPSMKLLAPVFQRSHELFPVVLSPHDLGYPYMRTRRLTMGIRRSVLQRCTVLDPPSVLFSCLPATSADIYFNAPEDEVEKEADRVAAMRSKPKRTEASKFQGFFWIRGLALILPPA
jgi:hypothetical protein